MFRRLIDIFTKKKPKTVKYPCRRCAYYTACGDGGRTKPCEDRKTKKELKEAGIMIRY